MFAIRVEKPGGPEVLVGRELPTADPGPGQVRVRLGASGVNFIDIYQRAGRYPLALPFTLGLEGAGTVDSIGAGVTSLAVGDRVAFATVQGAYATEVVAPADALVKVPDGVSLEQAAAAMLQGMTAHYLSESTYPIQRGDWVLVHAGAGGVGLLLTQLAARRGATVITTVSTPAKAELSRGAGASHAVLYTQQDFLSEVRRLTGGAGVAVVYDSVGKDTFEKSLECLRPRGMLALFGGSSGPAPAIDPMRLSKGSLFLTRPSLFHYVSDRASLEERAGEVLSWVASGELKLRIERAYPLAEARRAHEDLEGRRTTGKLLLKP